MEFSRQHSKQNGAVDINPASRNLSILLIWRLTIYRQTCLYIEKNMMTNIDPVHDYAQAYESYDLQVAKQTFAGNLDTGVNACIECCDRYAIGHAKALDWISTRGERKSFTFAELKLRSAKVANFLVSQGIKPGDVVSGLLPRTPELVALILGTLRTGAVYQPLFTAFGSKAIEHRIMLCGSKMIVTDGENHSKLNTIENCPAIAVISTTEDPSKESHIDYLSSVEKQTTEFEPVMRNGEDLMLMMSTSGTTGPAKGVPVPLRALLSFRTYMVDAIDLRPEDAYWNIADPGWAYGLYYAVLGPLLLGHCTTLFEGSFTVDGTYDILKRLEITNLAGSPTAYRVMIAAGPEAAKRIKGKLRVVSSAGEPLNPEVIRWFRECLDAPIFDHYGQTETGMIVNNHHALSHPVRDGSAGYAMPGFSVAVLTEDDRIAPVNEQGLLVVDIAKSPAFWFTGYLNMETKAITCGYYRTGDMVEQDENGCVTFVGRSDDVITSSGYRIGPFDVESALLEHPAVVETAVVGVPDPERTELVKAVVVLNQEVIASEELKEELRLFVRNRLSSHSYPRIIEFINALPKTPSGKVQRFLLRKQKIDN